MPRAKDLKEAYNRLPAEPLRTPVEFSEFYVQRPIGQSSPIGELRARIEIAEGDEKYLFLGFRGSGKSTELNRLISSLDKSRFLVVAYSVRETLDLSDFDFRDFFVSMALNIFDLADAEGITFEKDIEDDFEDFIKEIAKVSDEEITRTRALEARITIPQFISFKLSRERKTRMNLREALDTRISELIQRMNWLIEDVEHKTGRRILVIVDDLDKLTRIDDGERFFYENYSLLLQPKCSVVYTFPIPLTFHPYYENVRPAFAGDITLPQVPVKDIDGQIISVNCEFYKNMVWQRLNQSLVDADALNEAILSTGKISEFISVMRDACIKAYTNNRDKITRDDVDQALKKLRITYERHITEADRQRLLQIHETKDAPDTDANDSTTRDLLFSLTAVEYEHEGRRWCDVDPLLWPLVEGWKR